jgi:hypothetical protein
MWREVDSLKKQNESIEKEIETFEKEIETLRQKNLDLSRSNKLREGRLKRLKSIDSSAMSKALKLAALPEVAAEEAGPPRYDARVFKSQLLRQGLLDQDVDFLIDAFNQSHKGIIVNQAESGRRAVRMPSPIHAREPLNYPRLGGFLWRDSLRRSAPISRAQGFPRSFYEFLVWPMRESRTSQDSTNPRERLARANTKIAARTRRMSISQFSEFLRSTSNPQVSRDQLASRT